MARSLALMSPDAIAGEPSVDPCRAEPHHALPLRPPRRPVAAGGAPAPRPALPHADHQLLAAGRAGRAFRQLAAGPLCQPPGAAGLPREDHRVQGHGRPGGRHGGLQPLRLLPGAGGRDLPLRLCPRAEARPGAVPGEGPADAEVQGAGGQRLARGSAHHRLPGRAEPAAAARDRLSDPHGAGRADARSHADQSVRQLPRHRLAAGATAAPHGAGGALRVGLPDPAQARRQVARRAQRHRGGFHRPACLVRGLPARRRLGRAGPDLGPDGRRGPHPGGLHARAQHRCAGQRRGGRMRGDFRAPHADHAHLRIAACDQALYRGPVAVDPGAGPSGRRRTAAPGRAPDDGRRADFRLGGRPRRRRMERRCARPHQARLRHRAGAPAARQVRAGRLPALRPGQVVPGRAAAALGADHRLARRRPALLARPVAVCRRARAAPLHHRRCQGLHGVADAAPGPGHAVRAAGLRGHLVLPVARAPPAGQRRPLRIQARRRDGARAAAPHLHAGPGQRGRLPAAAEARMAHAHGRAEVDHRPRGSCATSGCT